MKTLTINTAGKRSTAYTTEEVSIYLSLRGVKRTNISIKEAKILIKGLPISLEGANFKTYKLLINHKKREKEFYFAVYNKDECLINFDTEDEAREFVLSENAGYGYEKLYFKEELYYDSDEA